MENFLSVLQGFEDRIERESKKKKKIALYRKVSGLERLIVLDSKTCPFCSSILLFSRIPNGAVLCQCEKCCVSYFSSADGGIIAFDHGVGHFCSNCGMLVRDCHYRLNRFFAEKSWTCPSCGAAGKRTYSFITRKWK